MTFDDNRITKDMLMDLSKVHLENVTAVMCAVFQKSHSHSSTNQEILKEMGITVMGDIISILKHAEKVHIQVRAG